MQSINRNSIPQHVAIIMDGNGRWAGARGLMRLKGHAEGVNALKAVVKCAQEIGIKYLTVYAFSTENWTRPADEVSGLMGILHRQLTSGLAELHEKNIRVQIIGDRKRLSEELQSIIKNAERQTQNNDGITLIIAFNYGGRTELLEAVRSFAREAIENPEVVNDLDEAYFADFLYTKGIPDPDLLIRTSGVARLSNFLLWQLSYAELIFCDTYWPDFTAKDLMDALREYQSRERRFGGTPAQL